MPLLPFALMMSLGPSLAGRAVEWAPAPGHLPEFESNTWHLLCKQVF